MCGFAGFLSFENQNLEAHKRKNILKLMSETLARRGPDSESFYDDGVISIVFRRLSIVGGADGGQPIINEDCSIILVANGEIYNHLELRKELSSDHSFSGLSDCEVILHAYEQWGVGMLEKIRGMFSIAIWDKKSKRLFIARDRLGIKPLYVCRVNSGLIFGSELKALQIHPEFPRISDLGALSRPLYALKEIPTYVKDVHHLPAGHYAEIDSNGGYVEHQYWRMESHLGRGYYGNNPKIYVSALQELIIASVDEHLQGEGGTAIHLSGGQDSSLLAACIAEFDKNTPCFSIVERTTVMVGDARSAENLCKSLGLPWFPVKYDFRQFVEDIDFDLKYLEESVYMMDSPRFDMEWIIKMELSRVIQREYPDIKKVIIGQGADEFAGGYSNRIDAEHKNWQTYLRSEIDPMIAEEANLVQVLNGSATIALDSYHHAMPLFARQLQHHNLWHEDRTSSWLGMEARLPFLDHRIVELLASIPAELHNRLFWDKSIIRECSHSIFPAFDSNRRKVGLFSVPDGRSIYIIAHLMACRAIPEFIEKYVDSNDFLYNRQEILFLAKSVTSRQPNFYANSFRLLQKMTATIFDGFIRGCNRIHGDIKFRKSLPIIASGDFDNFSQTISGEPNLFRVWEPSECLRVPVGCVISRTTFADGRERFSLVNSAEIFSYIDTYSPSPWISVFIHGVGDSDFSSYTIQDWIRKLAVDKDEFFSTLNVLWQSGFIDVRSKSDVQ